MKSAWSILSLVLCSAVLSGVESLQAATIERPTNFGVGADAEVRDWEPLYKGGIPGNGELAVRILNEGGTSDRNDLMFMRFDLTGLTAANLPGAIFRLSYAKDNNLRQGNAVDPTTGVRAGLLVYGLDVNDAGNSWSEANINYLSAPGLTFDGDSGNSDFDLTKVTLLGNIDFPDITPQNWFPVGGSMDLSGAALESFLGGAIAANKQSVTMIAGLQQDGDPAISGRNITNRTYLFVHKELLTLNDPQYDADTSDPNNPLGSPWHGASNANGEFSPRLVLQEVIPEPSSCALLGLALLGVASRRSALQAA